MSKKIAGRVLEGRTHDELPFSADELAAPQRRERARRANLARDLVSALA
jgi:hypothetical protein